MFFYFNYQLKYSTGINQFYLSHSIAVGQTMFFEIELRKPIPGIDMTVTDCTVTDDDLDLSFDILADQVIFILRSQIILISIWHE